MIIKNESKPFKSTSDIFASWLIYYIKENFPREIPLEDPNPNITATLKINSDDLTTDMADVKTVSLDMPVIFREKNKGLIINYEKTDVLHVKIISLSIERIEIVAELTETALKPHFDKMMNAIGIRWPESGLGKKSPNLPRNPRRVGRPNDEDNEWAVKELAKGKNKGEVIEQWKKKKKDSGTSPGNPKEAFNSAIKRSKRK